MELTLTDDQEFFRDTTLRFLGAASSPADIRGLADDPGGMPDGYWRQGAELGWTSLLVPEELGGGSISGSGVVDLTIVADAFGRHAAPGPLLPTNVVASALARSGSDAHRSDTLPGLLDGSVLAAWCGADVGVGEPPTVTASPTDGGFVLTGSVAPVEAAAQADVLLVTAHDGERPVQLLVPAGTAGVTITPLRTLDLVRRFARVELDGVAVGAEDRVGDDGTTAADVERQLQEALVIQTAELVGAAERTFDFTVEWAFDRYSFGRPLASYQELKHRFADMKTWLEASHALAAALAREVQAGDPSARETASIAKAYVGEHLSELMQDCLQMHGGIGLTTEHDLHLYLRRVIVDRSLYGTPAAHRRRITDIATEEDAA